MAWRASKVFCVSNHPRDQQPSPVERRIKRSLVDDSGVGKPLSRRARQTRRTLEAYLAAGVLPWYMRRLREIENEVRSHRGRLERRYRKLLETCGHDTELFASRWHDLAHTWSFDRVNQLIREHNEWYPVEAQLPMDPRTGDYIRIRGRSYRREELGPEWVLERFPASPRPERANARRRARR